ncbi:MAG: acyloxyacyl hydrolase [Bacteroidota bacterium]
MILYIICFITFWGRNSELISQDSIKKPFILGSKLHYGVILPHSERIRTLAFNNPFGIEVNFNWLNHSEKSVRQLNCYSYTGIAINYFNFGHPKIGSSVNLWYYFEPLLKFKNKLNYSIRAGTGITYLSTIYDQETNPENKFFSSHIAFLLIVDFKLKYKLTKKLELCCSICYNHISNGGFKQPNYGMNFPTITLGVDYNFKPINLKPIKKEKIRDEEKVWSFKAEVLSSIKVQNKTPEFKEKACFAYGFSSYTNKRISKFSALNFGLEYIADGYVKEEILRAGLDMDYKRAAGFIGHDLTFGKVNLTVNIGIYFYSPYKAKDPVYEKYMLQYRFNKFYTGVFMLAHGDAAEIMGFNAGFVF